MRFLETLMNEYVAISKQLSYWVGRKVPAQIAKYSSDQRDEAIKLIVALARYHGISEAEFESEVRKDV